MNFIIEGADAKTGKDRRLELEADDEQSAVKAAKSQGVFPYRVSQGIESASAIQKPPDDSGQIDPDALSTTIENGLKLALAALFLLVCTPGGWLVIAVCVFLWFSSHAGQQPTPSSPTTRYSAPSRPNLTQDEESRLMNNPNMRGYTDAEKRHVIGEAKKLADAIEELERRRGR